MKKLMISLLLICQLSYAADDVLTVKKGDIAPFDGVLFSREREQKLRLLDKNFETCTDLNTLYQDKIKIQEQRIDIRDKQVDVLTQKVVSTKEDMIWTKIGFFILGSVITGGIAYGVSRTLK